MRVSALFLHDPVVGRRAESTRNAAANGEDKIELIHDPGPASKMIRS